MVPAYLILAAYILCTTVHCIGLSIGNKKVSDSAKPLLMPLLLIFYLLEARNPDMLVVGALSAGFLGDIFLMGKGLYFLLGLTSFLCGHLFYIATFLLRLRFQSLSGWILLTAIVFVIYSILIYRSLRPYLGNVKKTMIIAYISVLLCMSFCAFLLFVSSPDVRTAAVFLGSLAFIASDSMLAYDVYEGSKRWRTVLVMVTYTMAQGLLVAGLL